MYRPNSTWTWAFVAVTLVQAAIIIAFESYVFARFQTNIKDSRHTSIENTIPTFLTLYIFGFIYELLLVYDALRLKNTIQVIGLCLFNVALLIYAVVQKQEISDAVRILGTVIEPDVWASVQPFLVAIPCIIAGGTIAMSFIARNLYNEFAWTIYKHISADLKMKRRYLTYQIYIALLKFDFFFFLGFTIQFVVIVVDKNDIEFILTIVAIPVTIVILVLAGYFTRKESRPGMAIIICLYLAGMVYFFFKLVRMYQDTDRARTYIPVRKSLTTFAVLTIILIFMTIANAIMCMINFGRGLKPYIANRKVESEDEKPNTEMANFNLGPMPVSSRMTID